MLEGSRGRMVRKVVIKKLKITCIILCSIILICITIILTLFHQEINTILSIKMISDKPAYKMTYHGEYALDKYLSTGAKNWGEVLNFINENLGRGVGKFIYKRNECSSFFAITPEGDYILARNLDTTEAIPSVIKTDTKNGGKTIGVTNLMRGGWNEKNSISKLTSISSPYFTLDGMNEYGLGVATSTVLQGVGSNDQNKVYIHDLTVNRVLLDKAKNLKEALEIMSKINVVMEKHYPSHYMIADKEGNCAIVEYIDGKMQVIKKSGNYQIATNFVQYNNTELIGYSAKRYHDLDKVLTNTNGRLTEEAALRLLIDNVVPGEAQWSVVYNLTRKTMAITFYNDYENTYHFKLK